MPPDLPRPLGPGPVVHIYLSIYRYASRVTKSQRFGRLEGLGGASGAMDKLLEAFKCCTPKTAVPAVDLLKEPPDTTEPEAPPPAAAPAPPPPPVAKSEPEVTEPPKPAPPSLTPEAILSMNPDSVIATMQKAEFASNAELMGAACKQLRVLCRQDEHCKVCDSLGAAGVIYKTMLAHAKVPAVQQQACAALINLCAGESFDRRDHAAESGAIKAIIAAMEAHIEYPGIQEMAFVAIQNICFGQDANGQSRKDRAIDAGAFKTIVDAIKKYEDTSSVLDQGAATLRLLCNKNNLLKAKAMEAGAKKDWLKSSGGSLTARVGTALTSRMGLSSRSSPGK